VKRLVLLSLVVAGCATSATQQAMAPSFAEVFAGRYAAQQQALGRTDVVASALQARATCGRTGTSPEGPGEDWTCSVTYADGVTSGTQVFEVQVKPDGCWKADGPPTVQAPVIVDALTGEQATNPLVEFDGCLDTSW
jgi:hypothetical protein